MSLVPSLTEAVAVTAPGLVVGATDWCTQPTALDVVRVGGTKSPDTDRIIELAPDVVLANFEENRVEDLEALRATGLPVWVTAPRGLDDAFGSLGRMLRLGCALPSPGWLDDAVAAWRMPYDGARRRAVVPIWRRPWMVLGRETFAGDVLARLGVDNLYATSEERYPKVALADLNAHSPDLVVLPDEPYAFSAQDGPEAFPGLPCAPVSGRHLTWYGPSLVEARELLARQLAHPVPGR